MRGYTWTMFLGVPFLIVVVVADPLSVRVIAAGDRRELRRDELSSSRPRSISSDPGPRSNAIPVRKAGEREKSNRADGGSGTI